MQLTFFYLKDIHKHFWKIIDFVENLEMTQIAGGDGVMFFVPLRRNAYENRYVIHPLITAEKKVTVSNLISLMQNSSV